MPAPDRVFLGKAGEDAACAELLRRGYVILARGYRTRAGEIDIIGADRGTLAFVEVKARTTEEYGDPAEAVTRRKQAKITAMAEDYLARTGWRGACRFDVVTVALGPTGQAVAVEVIQDAFDAAGWH